jgi:hypothetical protein
MKMLTLAAVIAAVALPVAAQSAQKPEAHEPVSHQVEQAKAGTPAARKANAKLAKAHDKQSRKTRRDKRGKQAAAPKA